MLLNPILHLKHGSTKEEPQTFFHNEDHKSFMAHQSQPELEDAT